MLKVLVSPLVVQEARNAENIAIETMRHSLVAFSDRPRFHTLPLLRFPRRRHRSFEYRPWADSCLEKPYERICPSRRTIPR